jgi:hypothetical protein
MDGPFTMFTIWRANESAQQRVSGKIGQTKAVSKNRQKITIFVENQQVNAFC